MSGSASRSWGYIRSEIEPGASGLEAGCGSDSVCPVPWHAAIQIECTNAPGGRAHQSRPATRALRQPRLDPRAKDKAQEIPERPSLLLYLDHIEGQGVDLFHLACGLDLEGIVAKPKASVYRSQQKPWIKVKNPSYSQAEGRRELFDSRR